jgi:methionyl-tRNA synthetase
LDQLAVPAERRSFEGFPRAGALKAGTLLPKPEPVFPRYAGDEPAQG